MQLNSLKTNQSVMDGQRNNNINVNVNVSDDGSNDSNEQLTLPNVNRINNHTRPSVLKNVTSYIIITEFCERLAYYGFAGSLVLFFQTILKYSNAESDIQYSTWSGVCYVTPLLGGYIADTYLGRYKTILAFCLLYVIGLIFLVSGAAPNQSTGATAGLAFIGIYLISFGTGGIKPNVSTLGADQFDTKYEQDRIEKESFFNYFYWMINLGALISYTLVAYICQYGINGVGGLKMVLLHRLYDSVDYDVCGNNNLCLGYE
jgi:peptide/histidine transporter 3/4